MPLATVNGVNLHYHDAGQGSPLLFLSGVGSVLTVWDSIVERLKSRHQCIALDNRGVGFSEKPDTPYTIAEMAADALGLLKDLGIEAAHVVGQSMGGMIAQEMARQQGASCLSITLCDTVAYIDGRTRVEWDCLRIFSRKLVPQEFAYAMVAWGYSRKTLEDKGWVRKFVESAAANPNPTPPHTYDHQVNTMLAFDSRPWLKDLRVPTLVVVGADDISTPPYQSQYLAQHIPGARYACLSDAGHRVIHERQDDFLKMLTDFIDEVEKS